MFCSDSHQPKTALANLSTWFPALFSGGATPYHDGYRVTSKWLKRDLQEDISALPIGIQDFGLERGFTPIDLVIEHRHCDKFEAKAWLCECLGIEDEVGITFNVEEVVEPTAPAASFHGLEAAREALGHIVHQFLDRHFSARGKLAAIFHQFARECGFDHPPDVGAFKTATGLGKTLKISAAIAGCEDIKRCIYGVPNHKLSAEIEQRFAKLGVSAKIFRGRLQDDPNNPGFKMCLKPDDIELATQAKLPIGKTCCHFKKFKCEHYEGASICGYEAQKQSNAKVIVVASDMFFHDEKSLGHPDIVVIDEAIWKKSLRGIGIDEDGFSIPLATLKYDFKGKYGSVEGRRLLAEELERQTNDGGLEFYIPYGVDDVHETIVAEWDLIEKLTKKIKIYPGLPLSEFIRRRERYRNDIDQIVLARNVVTLLQEIRNMKRHPEIKVSGRVLLQTYDGVRSVRWRGIAPIVNRYKVPTLLADATLPDLGVLETMFPNVRIVGDISVDFPECVKVRQYLGSPTSANKLVHTSGRKPERHLIELRRHILRSFIETGRQPTLVICQQKAERWLNDKLPKTISIAHFNAISGLDAFKHVRLLIIAGRTIPNPLAVETIAATLSGAHAGRHRARSQWFSLVRPRQACDPFT